MHVVVPGHLHALLQQLVHADLHARHRHAAWLGHHLELADAALAGAVLDPQEDQQVQLAGQVLRELYKLELGY